MSWAELKSKGGVEVQRELAMLREQLRDARFRVSQGQLPNVRQVRTLKRDISRHLTKLQQLAVTTKTSTTNKPE